MVAPRILIHSPTLAMSLILNLPVPNMMALGGVATGNINANEHETVAGIINIKGFILIAIAKPPIIGNNISAVAVFEVSSVKKVTNKHIQKMINIGDHVPKIWNCEPIQFAKPVSLNPFARANPPPNKRTI